jgi:hypothetical protein
MTPQEAVERLNTVLAHAWMVRTFLKHADEIQASEEMLDVPRTLYDGIRAVEPAYQRGDLADYLRRLKGKLPKVRRAAEYFAAHFKEFSPHTNFEMAAASLAGVVRQMEEIFAAVDWNEVAALAKARAEDGRDKPGRSPGDPLDDIEIPEV